MGSMIFLREWNADVPPHQQHLNECTPEYPKPNECPHPYHAKKAAPSGEGPQRGCPKCDPWPDTPENLVLILKEKLTAAQSRVRELEEGLRGIVARWAEIKPALDSAAIMVWVHGARYEPDGRPMFDTLITEAAALLGEKP